MASPNLIDVLLYLGDARHEKGIKPIVQLIAQQARKRTGKLAEN
jgi:hypothetical protein